MDMFANIVDILSIVLAISCVILTAITFIGTASLIKSKETDPQFEIGTHASPHFEIIMRILDFIFALLSLFIFTPILVVVSVIIKINTKETVLIKESILGRNNKDIYIYKFRTSTNSGDPYKPFLVGKFLKKTALSELPLIINVLKGDLALFGLAKIKSNNLLEIEQYVPTFRESYTYYRPGVVSLNNLMWSQAKTIEKTGDYYIFVHRANIEFLSRRSLGYILNLLAHTIYLAFIPFED